MCLALPARVVDLRAGDTAVVDLGGVRKTVSLALVDGIAVGDFVIIHVGYALSRLDPEEAERTLALLAALPEPEREPEREAERDAHATRALEAAE